ncbi:MarR family winged helix-turn-helix transcriptional regulator [Schleiferia thermophila]|jgi:DNA-binding MarR family transcriptional regulator|uniref:MarR family winged helix-turn-helix transcriptional regulator n=1 Tax=Schleiferia thermophila TaxID=884107 RepID=UPI002FDA6BE7
MKIDPNQPLAVYFAYLTKLYIGAVSKKLNTLEIDRYYYTLITIHDHQPEITQQQLADILQTDKVTTFRVVDHFCKIGYVRREVNPEDRRSLYLYITPKGEKVIPEIKKTYKAMNSICLKGISEEEKETFFKVLERIIENVEKEPRVSIKINYKQEKSRKANLSYAEE